MNIEELRTYCLSLPHATEDIQWGDNLLFRIGGKMFLIVNLDPASEVKFSFKCSPEKYIELLEIEGIIPAPYLARYKWVAIESFDLLGSREIKQLIKASYDMVASKLSKKIKSQLERLDQ
ncbi:MAG: MmcQ/YjbR family DNA-binding protein [Blastocatellia bacterium]|nr:MmcQ/YjbR family DNA-binding protein [Blastocatellia bacterium]